MPLISGPPPGTRYRYRWEGRYYDYSDRVNAAIRRISRDRYIFPWEVEDIVLRLAECSGSSRPRITAAAAISFEATQVGMLRGRPLFYRWEEGYSIFAKELKKVRLTRETWTGRDYRGHAGAGKELGVLIAYLKGVLYAEKNYRG